MKQHKRSEVRYGYLPQRCVNNCSIPKTPLATPPNNNKTILIIEDDWDMAQSISSILTLAHYNVMCAPGGLIGVQLALRDHPDLILCDVIMPDLDGYGVLHILSNDSDFAGTPFIFLSAMGEMNDLRNGMNLGADDFILKPFKGLELLKVVEIRLRKMEKLKLKFLTPSEKYFNGSIDFEKLTLHKHLRLLRKKELVFLEGQPAFDLFYIVTGTVKTYKVSCEGKELITGFYHTGDFLGYIPLIEEKPYHESAETMERTEIAVISKHHFLDLIYSSKSISKIFLKLLSSTVVETESRMLEIAYQSVRQRVAGALLKIDSRAGIDSKGMILTSRKDLSYLVGTATESLNRTLADFKLEGLIEITDAGITIVDKIRMIRNCKPTELKTPFLI